MKYLLLMLFLFTSITFASVHQEIRILEQKSGGRLGISAIDTGTGQLIEYRARERFLFCSTFKVMGVAAVLKKSMKDNLLLNRTIHYTKKDLVEYSPVTEQHVHDGMSVVELSKATITMSDNTAINLLMHILGGPKSISDFARTIGDHQFNLTSWEPDLNSAIPGEKRDTTTPKAMRESLKKLLLGSVLNAKQQKLLRDWLVHNTTGDHRIRSGVPNYWIVAEKTGTGSYGTTNDIGIVYPLHCKPIDLVIYFTQKEKNATANESVIASATKILISEFRKTNKCLQDT